MGHKSKVISTLFCFLLYCGASTSLAQIPSSPRIQSWLDNLNAANITSATNLACAPQVAIYIPIFAACKSGYSTNLRLWLACLLQSVFATAPACMATDGVFRGNFRTAMDYYNFSTLGSDDQPIDSSLDNVLHQSSTATASGDIPRCDWDKEIAPVSVAGSSSSGSSGSNGGTSGGTTSDNCKKCYGLGGSQPKKCEKAECHGEAEWDVTAEIKVCQFDNGDSFSDSLSQTTGCSSRKKDGAYITYTPCTRGQSGDCAASRPTSEYSSFYSYPMCYVCWYAHPHDGKHYQCHSTRKEIIPGKVKLYKSGCSNEAAKGLKVQINCKPEGDATDGSYTPSGGITPGGQNTGGTPSNVPNNDLTGGESVNMVINNVLAGSSSESGGSASGPMCLGSCFSCETEWNNNTGQCECVDNTTVSGSCNNNPT